MVVLLEYILFVLDYLNFKKNMELGFGFAQNLKKIYKIKESFKINEDSIEIVSTKIDILEQIKNFIPLISKDCIELNCYYKNEFGSMGAVEIEPFKFYYEEADKEWNKMQKAYISQLSIFAKVPLLEKIGLIFKLKYFCKNSSNCNGHDQQILCWEFYEAYRNFLKKYSSEENALKKIENAFWKRFSKDRNLYLILGTHSRYPNVWMIGGYFCPLKKDVDDVNNLIRQMKIF